jgi:hypothetical protein
MAIPVNPGNFSGLAAVAGRGAPNLSLPIPGSQAQKAALAREGLLAQVSENRQNRDLEREKLAAAQQARQTMTPYQQAQVSHQQQGYQLQKEKLQLQQKAMMEEINGRAIQQVESEEKDTIEAKAMAASGYLSMAEEDKNSGETRQALVAAGVQQGWWSEEESQALLEMPREQFDVLAKSMLLQSTQALKIHGQMKKKAESSAEKRIYDPETGQLVYETMPATKPNINKTQEEIGSLEETAANIDVIDQKFDRSYFGPWAEYLKTPVLNTASGVYNAIEDISGGDTTIRLDKDNAEWLTSRANFKADLMRTAMVLIKQLSGVQYSDKQLEFMFEFIPDIKTDSPETAEGKIQSLKEGLKRSRGLKEDILKEGYKVGSPAYQKEYLRRMKENITTGTSDTGATYMKDGKTYSMDTIKSAADKLGITPQELIRQRGLEQYAK